MGSSRGLLLIFESLLEFSLFGMAEVLIPVKVCLLVTIVPLAKDLPATPILAEVLRVELVITAQDAGVLAGGLGTLRGVWIGGGNGGAVWCDLVEVANRTSASSGADIDFGIHIRVFVLIKGFPGPTARHLGISNFDELSLNEKCPVSVNTAALVTNSR